MHNTIAIQQVFTEAGQTFIENTLSLQDDAAVGALAEMLQAQYPQYDPTIEIINSVALLFADVAFKSGRRIAY